MPIIYTPKGRAKEYCDLACNLYTGCDLGCSYCYNPNILRKTPEQFHSNVQMRAGILDKINKEAPKHTGKEVLLCFACDPYPLHETEHQCTREAIRILISHGIKVRILTKSGMRSIRDFDLLKTGNHKYGTTLTFIQPRDSLRFEPFAATPGNRISALIEANKQGVKTWVSLEPVIDPSQTIDLVKRTAGFVDEYKVGKWNYDKRANTIDWKMFLRNIIELFKKENLRYYIKEDLREYA